MKHLFAPAFLAMFFGAAAAAAPLEMALPPAAELLREQDRGLATLHLPVGPAKADLVPTRAVEGHIWRRSWRVTGAQTTLEVFAPLRDALQAAGFHVEYSCAAQACGGFAFRFGIDTIPAPDMRVRISDFQFLSASRDADGMALSLLVSRSGGAVYVQVIERHSAQAPALSAADAQAADPDTAPPSAQAPTDTGSADTGPADATAGTAANSTADTGADGLRQMLLTYGHVVLTEVEFQSGSAVLTSGKIQSLQDLATLLRAEPDWKVLIVGHTDTVGSLDANTALSRRRAAAVRQHLQEVEGMRGDRLQVAGAGFMAPLTQNATPEGREENRRVEVVLIAP